MIKETLTDPFEVKTEVRHLNQLKVGTVTRIKPDKYNCVLKEINYCFIF